MLDPRGTIQNSRLNLSKLPAASQDELEDFGSQMQSSLEVVCAALPDGQMLQPGQTWSASRRIGIGLW